MARILSNFAARRFASRLIYSEYGQPSDVVRLEKFDAPTSAEDDKVVCRMLASPINPADINTIQGVYKLKPTLPAVGGGEGVGEVLLVGDKVKNIQPGDWVFPAGNMTGTWTTHPTYCETDLVKIRKDMPLLNAATLRINPGTAYRMLKDFVSLPPGSFVIQNGANSAVGLAVIEIARPGESRLLIS